MSDKTGIAWTDATWNPVTGCSKVSQGCKNCYAEREWGRLSANPKATAYYGRSFSDVACHEDRLDQPLRWEKPRMIFLNSMSDLFHEDVPDAFIDRVFAVMALAKRHTFQVLTKRPERMLRWFDLGFDNREHAVGQAMREIAAARGGDDAGLPEWPLPNVWLGVSVEDQTTADERIPLLLQTPAAVRWVSAEPLLNFIDLERVAWPNKCGHRVDVLRGGYWNKANCIAWGPSADLNEAKGGFTNHSDFPSTLDWVVCGGESGMKNARPMHAEWARKLHDDCAASGVSFYMKQLGAAFVDEKNGIAGAGLQVDHDVACMVSRRLRDRTGANMDEWPEDLRVRKWPKEASDASK
ncbi:phage Gp37/Gp68 family protein [Acidithiobacillus ferrooxidans]|uniref:DUF5131 family protein n=1 Tax=Acidithiobacillus ferrooxidans TaxID=920 RepID=UPI001C074DE7|nr:phage Gp37/Gp68 family protein [Acidithiobacillus ferrooxidans]MBU2773369.1 phage Gp37/Gp68 family protein [Acidithiobacillus ferrooxidans]